MTGPPTPPPTSAIEIQDAQREVSVPPAATTAPPEVSTTENTTTAPTDEPIAVEEPTQPEPTPTTPLNTYQLLFPTLADLASKGNFQELIEIAERGDLTADGDHHPTRLLTVAPLVLAYLIVDDLPPARAVLTRLPPSLGNQSIVEALFSLVASASERQYDRVYPKAEALVNIAQAISSPDYDISTVITTLTTSFIDSFRRKTFALLSKAYSSLPLSVAQSYLGFSAEQMVSVASEHNWKYDPQNQVLTPSPPSKTSFSVNGIAYGPSSLATLESLGSGLIPDSDF